MGKKITNYLKGTALGMSAITGYNQMLDNPSQYDSITFYSGNDGCIIDRVFGTNDIINENIILDYSRFTKTLLWTENTYLLAEFSHNFSGGNISGVENPIENWLIYRMDCETNQLKYIDSINADKYSYSDFTAIRDKEYKYWLFAKNTTEMSSPLVTESVHCDYHGWYLIDFNNQVSHAFDLTPMGDMGGAQTNNQSITSYEVNRKYKIYSVGKMEYLSSTVSAIIYDNFEPFIQTVDYINLLKEFISDGRKKYLKDDKGRIYEVFTSNFSESTFYEGDEPIRLISFNFEESGVV